jgi:hypothetical protein
MRIAALVAAGLIALLSLGLLAAGAALLWGQSQRDEHGYLSTSRERFATNGYALTTERLEVDAGWIFDRERYGDIRIEAASRHGEPVFVGIARSRDVAAYLRDVNHDVVSDISFDPFRADYGERRGDAEPGRPAGHDIWAASASGPGLQAVTWDVEEGDWSLVVMNADSSRGVDVEIKAGAELPFLASLGWGGLISGAVALLIAATIAVVGSRRRVAVPA